MSRAAFSCLLLLAASAGADEGWVTHSVALSPDGKTVVRGRMHAEEGTSLLRIESAGSGEVRHELPASGPIRSFAFRADGARFVASNDHGPIRIYDTSSGKAVVELAGHRRWVYSVAFAGGRVASAGRDETVRVWDAQDGKQLCLLPKTKCGVVALSPDGKQLATGDEAGRVQLRDAATGAIARELDTGDPRWILKLAYSPDGKRLAAGSRRIRVFEVADGRELATISLHEKKSATALAFRDDGARLATADATRAVRIWRLGGGEAKAEHEWTAAASVGALVFSRDGKRLTGAAYYGGCQSWPPPRGS